MPDIKLSQLPSASPATAAEGARLWTGKGHIDGLRLEWVSGTSLRVTSGMAYIESLGYAIDVPAAITKSSLSLTVSTWYHVYLFDNAGTPDIEIVTTAPAAAYSGTARSKAGDSSRRWLGRLRTDSAGSIRPFGARSCQVSLSNPAGGGSATASIPNATDTAVPFGYSKFDGYGMWDSAAPTDIVVPGGVTRVRLVFNAAFATNVTGSRLAYVSKNGSGEYPGRPAQRVPAPNGFLYMNAISGLVDVVPGDVFRLQVFQDSGAALNVSCNSGGYTWIAVEVVEDDYAAR